jgi:hypothetical protein
MKRNPVELNAQDYASMVKTKHWAEKLQKEK